MSDEILRIYKSTLTGIANAIRTKNPDVSGLIPTTEMEQDILDIPSGSTPYSPSSFNIVESLPSTLTNEAIYLIPNGEQIVPPLPLSIDLTMNRWAVTCEVPNEPITFPYSLTLEKIKNASKYYCFGAKVGTSAEPISFVSIPRTRSSNPGDMNFAESNTITMPTYIYKYEPATDTNWVDITSTITQTDWNNHVIDYYMLHCFYSTYTMIRNGLNQIAYETAWNAIDTNGRLIRTGDVTTYDIYYVDNGVAVNKGTKKTILELYTMLINGEITPTPVTLSSLSLQEPVVENTEETTSDNIINENTDE